MTQLALDGANAVLKKISINVLGKDAANTLFTLPLEGIELSREQLNGLLGDRTFEAWYKQNPDGAWHPMDYWRLRKNGDFHVDDEFTCDAATITVSGDKSIEFETEEADGGDPDSEDQPAAKIHSLVFKPTAGGVTLLSLHMQVRPRTDKNNLLLQKHMYRPIKISLEGERKERRGQQTLPLSNGAAAAEEGEQRQVSGGFVQTRSAEEIDAEMRRRRPDGPVMGDEAASQTQAAAASAKGGQVIDGTTAKSRAASRSATGGPSRHR